MHQLGPAVCVAGRRCWTHAWLLVPRRALSQRRFAAHRAAQAADGSGATGAVMVFQVAVVFFSRHGRLVTTANVIAEGARKVLACPPRRQAAPAGGLRACVRASSWDLRWPSCALRRLGS